MSGAGIMPMMMEPCDAILTLACSGHPARRNGVQAGAYAGLLTGPEIGRMELWGYGGARTMETPPVWGVEHGLEELLAHSIKEKPFLQVFVPSVGFMQHVERVTEWMKNDQLNASGKTPDAYDDLKRFNALRWLGRVRIDAIGENEGSMAAVSTQARRIKDIAFQRGANKSAGLVFQATDWGTVS